MTVRTRRIETRQNARPTCNSIVRTLSFQASKDGRDENLDRHALF